MMSEKKSDMPTRAADQPGGIAFAVVSLLAVLLIGALLYLVMALIRAVAIGRMEGMQDEALAYRRKAWRAAVFAAVVLLGAVLTGWW